MESFHLFIVMERERLSLWAHQESPSARKRVLAFVSSNPYHQQSRLCVAIGVEVLGRVRQEEEKTKNMVSLGLLLKRINVRCGRLLHACIGETSWCLSTL